MSLLQIVSTVRESYYREFLTVQTLGRAEEKDCIILLELPTKNQIKTRPPRKWLPLLWSQVLGFESTLPLLELGSLMAECYLCRQPQNCAPPATSHTRSRDTPCPTISRKEHLNSRPLLTRPRKDLQFYSCTCKCKQKKLVLGFIWVFQIRWKFIKPKPHLKQNLQGTLRSITFMLASNIRKEHQELSDNPLYP